MEFDTVKENSSVRMSAESENFAVYPIIDPTIEDERSLRRS